MNILVRKFKAAQNIVVRNFRWQMDSILCRKKIKQKELLSLDNKRIVVLAPHSDDEWIGCCRLLLSYPDNITVINMDMHGGDSEELHTLRFKEMQCVAKEIGYELITTGQDKEDFLCQFLIDNAIDLVMLPCYYDWHDEHFEVMEILSHAVEKSGYDGLIGMYQVSLPIPFQKINYGLPMKKKELRYKWICLKKFYGSQSFLPVRRFMINEHINGKLSGSYALEAYSVQDFNTWKNGYLSLEAEDKIKLSDNIQNIAFCRNYLQNMLKR